MHRRRHLLLALLLVGVALLAALVPTRSLAADDDTGTTEYTSWDDLAGRTVGLVTGAPFEGMVREKCPEVGGCRVLHHDG